MNKKDNTPYINAVFHDGKQIKTQELKITEGGNGGSKDTTVNKYQCNKHELNLCCLGCVKAWIARHDKMIQFLKELRYSFIDFGDDYREKQIDYLFNEMGIKND